MKTTKVTAFWDKTEVEQKGAIPNIGNSGGMLKKIQFLLVLFLMTNILQAQNNIEIETGDAPYYCGSVMTLIAPGGATQDYYWVTTGSLTLTPVNTTGPGFGALTVRGNNKVDVLVSGEGEVTVACTSCGNPPPSYSIDLAPDARVFSPEMSVAYGDIYRPNGIQTERPWICLTNDLSDPVQVLTVKNDTPFDIFWSITGGAKKVGQTYEKVGAQYVATVSIQTTGTSINKGFIRAYVSDACGNVACGNGGSGIDWEILKNIVPDEVFGVTCLRDNNLDLSRSTVYSVPDQIAGNAVFDWELYDNTNTLVTPSDPRFGIESTVLYGNSATITYKGSHTPSSVGNFKLRIINKCGATFEREITVSPEAPITTQETYCVPETIGTIETIGIANPESGKIYTWTAQGDVDWTITPNGNGSTADVTFNDTASGIIIVKASNSNDPTCTSDGTIVYINRNGGEVSVSGVSCIQRGTTEAFSFTASPFGQFDWEITPSLPTNWTISNGGNILTVTPPTGGITISGNYTVTASLQGCATDNTASFDFEIGPEKPVINGKSCVMTGTVYTYEIISEGAAIADVNIFVNNEVIPFRI